jgi:uncharacterized RDD family membrane protein YckC
MRPAGFWRRSAAWSLDASAVALPAFALCHAALREAADAFDAARTTLVQVLASRMMDALGALDAGRSPLAIALGWMSDPALHAAASGIHAALVAMLLPALLAFVPLFLAWCVGFERSRWQATPGKRALGLRVVAADGGRATTGAVVLRFVAGALSWLTLNLGHLMAALPPLHAALHDRLSGTRVRLAEKAPSRMPVWAVGWLLLWALVVLTANAWLLAGFERALLDALDATLDAGRGPYGRP